MFRYVIKLKLLNCSICSWKQTSLGDLLAQDYTGDLLPQEGAVKLGVALLDSALLQMLLVQTNCLNNAHVFGQYTKRRVKLLHKGFSALPRKDSF